MSAILPIFEGQKIQVKTEVLKVEKIWYIKSGSVQKVFEVQFSNGVKYWGDTIEKRLKTGWLPKSVF